MPNQFDIIQIVSEAGLMVQFVLLLLLFFSVTSWAIIFIKFRYLRRAFRDSEKFTGYFWKSRDLAGVYAKSKQLKSSPIARVFRIGYLELKKAAQSMAGESRHSAGSCHDEQVLRSAGADTVERALRRAINSEITRMTQMVPFLATTGNTTPFIGLFGTVWGIMHSFHGIGMRGSASLAVVAPGISEALIATAAGLGVAIPAVIAFNYFMQRIRMLENELQSFSADFLNIVQRDILAGKGR